MSDYTKIDERKYWLKCLVDGILGDDGLCEGCKYVDHGSCYKCRRTGANEILKIIDTDVAPVRHGRWYQDAIYYGEDGSPCIVDICTECGAYGYYTDFKYCPNCGAKMDEGEDNEID